MASLNPSAGFLKKMFGGLSNRSEQKKQGSIRPPTDKASRMFHSLDRIGKTAEGGSRSFYKK